MSLLAKKLAEAQARDQREGVEPAEPVGFLAKLHAAQEDAKRKLSITWASSVPARSMQWLWSDRIPLGAFTVLLGEEGLGKTTVAVRLAAMATLGTLPGEYFGQPCRVLFASAEDARDTVLVPRLMAAKADLSLVGFVNVKTADREEGLEIPRDVDLLAELAAEQGIRLLVMDPVVAFMDSQTDSHRDKDTRVALGPLAAAAERADFAVVGVIHPNKSNSTSERTRMMGSVAFRAAARASLVFGLDPDDQLGASGSSRVLAPSKNNNAPTAKAHRVKIETTEVQAGDGTSIRTSRAVLGDTCDHRAADVLGAEKQHEKAKQQTSAETLLEALLPAQVADLKVAADQHGIGWRTFERAKTRLGVVSVREPQGSGYRWEYAPDNQPAI